jgi:hypothetical protein
MARLLGHRQTKGAATDKPNLLLPRHISTLPQHARPARRPPVPDGRRGARSELPGIRSWPLGERLHAPRIGRWREHRLAECRKRFRFGKVSCTPIPHGLQGRWVGRHETPGVDEDHRSHQVRVIRRQHPRHPVATGSAQHVDGSDAKAPDRDVLSGAGAASRALYRPFTPASRRPGQPAPHPIPGSAAGYLSEARCPHPDQLPDTGWAAWRCPIPRWRCSRRRSAGRC